MAHTAIPTVSMSARGVQDGSLTGFHLVSVVFQRAKQLQNGARPRVDAGDHKPTRVALLEVLADTVSWSAG
jgi:DNA-directed RNA polymerase subunit K/omega